MKEGSASSFVKLPSRALALVTISTLHGNREIDGGHETQHGLTSRVAEKHVSMYVSKISGAIYNNPLYGYAIRFESISEADGMRRMT